MKITRVGWTRCKRQEYPTRITCTMNESHHNLEISTISCWNIMNRSAPIQQLIYGEKLDPPIRAALDLANTLPIYNSLTPYVRGALRTCQWRHWPCGSDVARVNWVGEGGATQEQKWKEGKNAHCDRGAWTSFWGSTTYSPRIYTKKFLLWIHKKGDVPTQGNSPVSLDMDK